MNQEEYYPSDLIELLIPLQDSASFACTKRSLMNAALLMQGLLPNLGSVFPP
jgi:hypothetical protein